MNTENIKNIYFIGAGGIGMSALVRYFLSRRLLVAGYDRTPSQLTHALIQEGALLHFEDNPDLIPEECKDPKQTLVVVTPAIPDTHTELIYFQTHGFTIQKRAQVLGLLTQTSKGLCVAGTHGKTTTSCMLAHLLHQSHIGCNAFLGGISQNYHTNLLLSEQSPYTVIEADEFDRSFHWLTPYMTVITATDPDHLDIYKTKEAYLESFEKYTSLIRPDGTLLMHCGLEIQPETADGVQIYTYSTDQGDFHAENIHIGHGEISFDFRGPGIYIENIELGVPATINIENGIAAIAMAWLNGVTPEEIRTGMASFKGVERRFDFKIRTADHALLCDYAHHPEEIRQSIRSVKDLYPHKKVTAVFQPHLYTRTRDFYQEFADSLSLADEVVLLDIYPARELPIAGVSSELIFERLRKDMPKYLCHKENLQKLLTDMDVDVLILLGAGDIDNLAPEIAKLLQTKF